MRRFVSTKGICLMMIRAVLILNVFMVLAGDASRITTEPLVNNLSVASFLDNNGYIRLNISWREAKYDAEYISIYFNNSEECNSISDVEHYPVNRQFVIEPSMELEHPADHLMHGCAYNITLEDKKTLKSQSLNYQVPECVENKCQCKNFSDSPNKLTSIDLIAEDLFLLSWNKTTEANITVHYIYYQRKDIKDSIRTYIPEKNLQYRNNAVEIPMPDLKNGIQYTITTVFIDEYNECMYLSLLDYIEPVETHIPLFVITVVSIIIFLLLLYVISLCSPRVRKKLQKYLSILPRTYQPYESQDLSTPLSQSKIREEINAQYTPLEFVLKMHKYDTYEFPRNKILIKELIGEGDFGKVYLAKAYELGSTPGFTMVAVKQIKEGASEEEMLDFQTEIELLKKIGEHENIVKMLGCVTMNKPFMMIMELVPCGSLKKYLLNLRKKWIERKNSRIFFPDDMDEHWLQPSIRKSNAGKINYTSCVFESSSDGSYIVPVNYPPTPQSTDSSIFRKQSLDSSPEVLNSKENQSGYVQQSEMPSTPISMNSSRLPSSTETEFTNVDTEPQTPLMREMNRPLEAVLDHKELQRFAFQIACGMSYLEKKIVTHRDLAARNILITSSKVLKISDFGMSRTGAYVNRKSKRVPLRWMAIESIEDQKWDSKSDVWSFGVVLWEIGTLGAFPYEHTPDVLILPELKKGKRLDRPKICTDELYSLMLRCWLENPDERPTFEELVELLDVKEQKIYVDFSELSPKYVFPPTKV